MVTYAHKTVPLGHIIILPQKRNARKIEKILNLCGEILAQEVKNICIIGAARETIFQEYQGWRANSLALCQTLSGDWENRCLDSNQRVKKIYNRN